MSKLVIGTKFEALASTSSGDVTPGKVYTVGRYYEGEEDQPDFRDDAGEWNAAVSPGGDLYPDKFRILE